MLTMIQKDQNRTPDELQQHILGTYLDLRKGVAWLGFVFPILLWLAVSIQTKDWSVLGSISAYYWETQTSRTLFCGILFAIGVFLYLYKGYSMLENVLLNIAGACAPLIALCPTSPDRAPCCLESETWTYKIAPYLHGASALLFFAAIAAVCWFCADDTLTEVDTNPAQKSLQRRYRAIAVVMVVSMIGAFLYSTLLGLNFKLWLVELCGIWAFGWYWREKTRELGATAEAALEKKVADGAVEVTRGKVHRLR